MTVPDDTLEHELSAIYLAHQPWLRNWLRKKLGSGQDGSADFAQEAFLRLVARFRRERVREPRAFLVKVASGLLADHYRRQAVEAAWRQTLALRADDVQASAEDHYRVIEALQQLLHLLERMPARDREIFLMSQIDGLSYPQIAGRLAVTVNVVQKAMTRVLAHCYRLCYDG